MNKGLMTSGNIYKRILIFAIPLLLGNFFQLMYNTIDSIIVGNYVGKEALAAVGASSPVINLLIAFFQGLATGAGVVVSRYYGAGHHRKMSEAIHSFILFAMIFGLFLSVLGVTMTPVFLNMIGTPADVFSQAAAYLRVYFLGNIFVTVYNSSTGILQAVGDSRHPLYFLIASSILNVLLDILFVRVIGIGVVGAALATIICQGVSMVLVITVLMRTDAEYKLKLSQLKLNFAILKEIIRIGVPAGVQGVVVSVSNVIVMGYINSFGSASIAGFSSANKFDNFIGLPVNSFALAATTFCGQNLGAGEFERVRKGVRAALAMSITAVAVMGVIIYTNAPVCIRMFSSDPEVIEAGAGLIRIMCPFYVFLCFHQIFSSALRASGHSSVPMMTSIISFVVLRQIFLAFTMPRWHEISLVGYCYSFTWVLAALFTGFYYFHSRWLQKEQAHYKPRTV
ncbi:MAG: MATE family efflux transporter [Solobacterium sp.]|nr:MATE family efflux transporter [Solobacterium sp.]